MSKVFLVVALAIVACDEPVPSAVTVVSPLPAAQPAVARACDVGVGCADIQRACANAGFFPGGFTQQRGIKYDCLDVLLDGSSPTGVEVPRDEIACVQSHATRAAQGGADAENDFENQCIYSPADLARIGAMSAKKNACDAVDRACYAAGYYFGGYTQGRGIQLNCLQPLFEGKRVPRLRVDAPTLDACFGPQRNDAEGFRIAMTDASTLAPAP